MGAAIFKPLSAGEFEQAGKDIDELLQGLAKESGSIGSSGSSFAFSSSSRALSRSCSLPVGMNGHHVPVLNP